MELTQELLAQWQVPEETAQALLTAQQETAQRLQQLQAENDTSRQELEALRMAQVEQALTAQLSRMGASEAALPLLVQAADRSAATFTQGRLDNVETLAADVRRRYPALFEGEPRYSPPSAQPSGMDRLAHMDEDAINRHWDEVKALLKGSAPAAW